MGSPVQFVLNGLKKLLGNLRGRSVVDAGSIDFEDLAVEYFLRRSNVADAIEQFIEVATAALEQIIVHGKPLNEVLPQACRGPYAKLRAAERFYAVSHRDDDI